MDFFNKNELEIIKLILQLSKRKKRRKKAYINKLHQNSNKLERERDRDRDRETETDRQTDRQRQRQRENSNAKTLFYKDCSLVKQTETDRQTNRQSRSGELNRRRSFASLTPYHWTKPARDAQFQTRKLLHDVKAGANICTS